MKNQEGLAGADAKPLAMLIAIWAARVWAACEQARKESADHADAPMREVGAEPGETPRPEVPALEGRAGQGTSGGTMPAKIGSGCAQ